MNFPNERFERSMRRLRAHGTRTRYQQSCRCLPCRVASARYASELKERHVRGEPFNRLVSAEATREHLLKLSANGVGLQAISEITGIAKSTLSGIRTGRSKNLRSAKEEVILAITSEARVDGTRVSSHHMMKMIRRLRRQGFTHQEIAKRSGVNRGAFIPGRKVVTARTEMRIEKLFNKYVTA